MSEKIKKAKLDYRKTILIGFAFMASSVAWGIYDPYVTKLLDRILGNSETIAAWSDALAKKFPILLSFMEATEGKGENTLSLVPLFIGIIMTFDNIFGVIFQPTFGKISDRTHTRIGKRKPFILIGAPLAAIVFAIIPRVGLAENVSIPVFMACIILFVFIMSFWRAPCVALMPDLTPSELRSEGNSIINLVGGVGSFLALQAATVVCLIGGFEKNNPADEPKYTPYVFLLAAFIMIICTLVVAFFVKEPDSRLKVQLDKNAAADAEAKRKAEKEAAKAEKARLKAIKLSKAERKSLIFMLIGLFFLFCGSNAIQTFFALFADEVFHKTSGQATSMMTIFAASVAIGAVPAGIIGKKIGRKKTINLGLGLFILAFVAYIVVWRATGNTNITLKFVYGALVLGGFANMLITVNTLPLVLEIGGIEKVGTFTGYYYTATFSAQIATPIVYGIVRMLTGTYNSLFYYCPICFVLAFLSILMVKHGEAPEITEEVIKQARLSED